MVKVLLVTRQPIVINGFQVAVSSQPGFDIVPFTGSSAELLGNVQSLNPQVIVIDFTPEEHFGTVVALRERLPHCGVVLWCREMAPELAYQVMKIGVKAILRSTFDCHTVLECIERVAAGECWFEAELEGSFFHAKTTTLSARESQIILLVAQGLKNKEIAGELNISEATTRFYLTIIFRKLEIKDRYELAIFGLRTLLGLQINTESVFGTAVPEKIDAGIRFVMLQKPVRKPVNPPRTAMMLRRVAH